MQSAQLRQLLSVSNVSLVASISLAAVLAFMLRKVVASADLIAWIFLMLLASFFRAALVIYYQRSPEDAPSIIKARLTRFRLGVAAAGMAWGSAGFLLFPFGYPQQQMFLIFVLAGMTAGGVVSFSADLASAIPFSVLIILPLSIRLFVAGDSLSVAMGVATMLYLGFMILTLRRINRSMSENIILRFEASAREEAVRESEERYRLLLSHSPVGIVHYDANLVITYCNKRFADNLRTSIERLVGLDMKLLKDQSILPALKKALEGKTGFYEGRYLATFSEAEVWIAMTCAPSRDGGGNIVGGVAIVEDISVRKAAEEKIKTMAFYDHLTSLPNRRLLVDRLQHAMATGSRGGKKGALLFIDLNNFKSLNDTLGHDMGDLLLQQVAQRLASCVRDGDTVARLGGDEFVVMLEDLNNLSLEAAKQAEAVGEKILDVLGQPYQLAEHEFRCSASIGATLFNVGQQTTVELLKQADIAMYQAKRSGRSTLHFFDSQMQESINARVALEAELHKAIENRQFEMYYQPQVDNSGRVLGAEALIRWNHPERGLMPPVQFISLAEERGLIHPIWQWVLETACAQLRAWQQEAHTRNLILSINAGAKEFHSEDFAAQVCAVMQRHAINPKLLKLELTESMLLEDIEDTIATMEALRATGIRFSLDDFGTGYLPLQYLERLPFDEIKIDQSFVQGIAVDSGDKTIAGTIISMARSLNLEVIAEGVETEEQRQILLGKGCTQYQGYLFGKPVPIAQFEELLHKL